MNSEHISRVTSYLEMYELDKEIRVIHAVESGSRAWGYPSADSDYDIRFVYAHTPDWYLSVGHNSVAALRGTIEANIENLDFVGWDFKKALTLFYKSNPPLLERLNSHLIYREMPNCTAAWRDLIPHYYSPQAAAYHYYHMATGNYRQYLQGEEVWLKKYFYVLRPVLALNWIELWPRVPIPMRFLSLLNAIVLDQPLKNAINQLLQDKCAGKELEKGPRIDIISYYIDTELKRFESTLQNQPRSPTISYEPLNQFFRQSLEEIWND